jgi:vanillate O-demethylase monooxygenase subunit
MIVPAATSSEWQAHEERLYEGLRQFWHPVAYSAELTDAPLPVTLLGERLVLVRLGGAVRAFQDLCPHRGTPLSLGSVEDEEIRCAYHGWKYDCLGVLTELPASPESPLVGTRRLRPYRADERDGLIWVSLVDDPTLGLPEFPEAEDTAFRVVRLPAYEWACSAQRRTENVIDLAHFAWLHDGVLGVRDEPKVPPVEVTHAGGELRMEVEALEPAGTHRTAHLDADVPSDRVVTSRKRYRIFLPFTVLNQHDYPNGNRHTGFWAFSPVGPRRTRCFMQFARNHTLTQEEDDSVIAFTSLVNEQDRPIVEAQRPEELPADLTIELHVKGPDRAALEYRLLMADLTGARKRP